MCVCVSTVVHYDESLQINVYLDPTKDHLEMTTFNAQVKMDVIHPVLYIKQYAALTNDNANEIKGSLYTGTPKTNRFICPFHSINH